MANSVERKSACPKMSKFGIIQGLLWCNFAARAWRIWVTEGLRRNFVGVTWT